MRTSIGVAVLAVLALSAVGAKAVAADDLELPAPTGQHAVGVTDLWMKDTTRADTWVPGQPYRELMVRLWYPTDDRHGAPVEYMTAQDSAALLAGRHIEVDDPAILSRVRSSAIEGAAPVGKRHSLPLVVLSPGYLMPRMTLTALGEDLASHGYVVAAIDHTGESYSTTFPGGHVVGCTTCELDNELGRAFYGRLYQGRARDVSFVLDRLTGPHPAWRGAALIDASRIGVSGHSAGGATSFAAMVHDPRIDAGIDLDGTTDTGGDPLVPLETGLDRPFLVFSLAEHGPATAPDLAADYANLTGWKRWMLLTGGDHQSFVDVGLLVEWLGLSSGATLDPRRGIELSRRMNEAMFDRWLYGRPQPVLDDPARCYPEVTRV
ncbi:hypothetical protein [Actinoplanes sp. NPDC051851]|uniref:alpha/beta hydrolase family protein n=1 Tax=Actinoplanes sp. NPDC051851 TaxID=3154753 RepID=UPI00343A57A0